MRIGKNLGNFRAGIIFLAFACLFGSCTTQKGFLKYAYDHPDKVAELCAKEFPVVDSLGKPEVDFKPANNIDYRPTIDSLVLAAEALNERLVKAEKENNSETLKVIIREQQFENATLLKKVRALQDAYKPCAQDTLTVTLPVYRKSLAEITDLKNKLEKEKEAKIKAEADRDAKADEIKRLRKENHVLKIASAILGLVVIAGIFILVRR